MLRCLVFVFVAVWLCVCSCVVVRVVRVAGVEIDISKSRSRSRRGTQGTRLKKRRQDNRTGRSFALYTVRQSRALLRNRGGVRYVVKAEEEGAEEERARTGRSKNRKEETRDNTRDKTRDKTKDSTRGRHDLAAIAVVVLASPLLPFAPSLCFPLLSTFFLLFFPSRLFSFAGSLLVPFLFCPRYPSDSLRVTALVVFPLRNQSHDYNNYSGKSPVSRTIHFCQRSLSAD